MANFTRISGSIVNPNVDETSKEQLNNIKIDGETYEIVGTKVIANPSIEPDTELKTIRIGESNYKIAIDIDEQIKTRLTTVFQQTPTTLNAEDSATLGDIMETGNITSITQVIFTVQGEGNNDYVAFLQNAYTSFVENTINLVYKSPIYTLYLTANLSTGILSGYFGLSTLVDSNKNIIELTYISGQQNLLTIEQFDVLKENYPNVLIKCNNYVYNPVSYPKDTFGNGVVGYEFSASFFTRDIDKGNGKAEVNILFIQEETKEFVIEKSFVTPNILTYDENSLPSGGAIFKDLLMTAFTGNLFFIQNVNGKSIYNRANLASVKDSNNLIFMTDAIEIEIDNIPIKIPSKSYHATLNENVIEWNIVASSNSGGVPQYNLKTELELNVHTVLNEADTIAFSSIMGNSNNLLNFQNIGIIIKSETEEGYQPFIGFNSSFAGTTASLIYQGLIYRATLTADLSTGVITAFLEPAFSNEAVISLKTVFDSSPKELSTEEIQMLQGGLSNLNKIKNISFMIEAEEGSIVYGLLSNVEIIDELEAFKITYISPFYKLILMCYLATATITGHIISNTPSLELDLGDANISYNSENQVLNITSPEVVTINTEQGGILSVGGNISLVASEETTYVNIEESYIDIQAQTPETGEASNIELKGGNITYNAENSHTFNGNVDFSNATVTGLASGEKLELGDASISWDKQGKILSITNPSGEINIGGYRKAVNFQSETYFPYTSTFDGTVNIEGDINFNGNVYGLPEPKIDTTQEFDWGGDHRFNSRVEFLNDVDFSQANVRGISNLSYKEIRLSEMYTTNSTANSSNKLLGSVYIRAWLPKSLALNTFADVVAAIKLLSGNATGSTFNSYPAWGSSTQSGGSTAHRVLSICASSTSGYLTLTGLQVNSTTNALDIFDIATIGTATVTIETLIE